MIDAGLRTALSDLLQDRVEFDVPLSKHTSLRIGGPADAMVTPADREELGRVLAVCHAHACAPRVLGAGFNVLVSDAGLPGVVIRLKKLRGIARRDDDTIVVEAGASHATVTRFCVEHGLSGLEFGAGIPGTVGGWLAMNAGIGTRELKDVVTSVDLLAKDGTAMPPIARADLDFHYRALAGLPEGAVLVGACLAVKVSTREAVQAEIDRLLAHRQATQPTDIPSCGSVFRNPEGDFAGRLIEAAGLKGRRVGQAEISTVHANFIVNHGGASAADVLALIEIARETVAQKTNVELVTEVQLLGPAATAEGEQR